MQKVEKYKKNLCSLDPKDNWYTSDVTTDSNCVCPPGQTQVSKLLGEQTIYKCQLTIDDSKYEDQVDASSTRNLSNPNNPNNRNNPLTQNNPNNQNNLYNPKTEVNSNISNPNTSFNTAICDETPYNMKPDSWSGLSTDPTCNCPYPLTQVNTFVGKSMYYTCSWPVN